MEDVRNGIADGCTGQFWVTQERIQMGVSFSYFSNDEFRILSPAAASDWDLTVLERLGNGLSRVLRPFSTWVWLSILALLVWVAVLMGLYDITTAFLEAKALRKLDVSTRAKSMRKHSVDVTFAVKDLRDATLGSEHHKCVYIRHFLQVSVIEGGVSRANPFVP